ncbi:MAG: glycosyltransferase family 2 protein [Chitinophagaceae bacterium]|nr:glycosyltransferase family 2 protein [Chitinophagaceae bacterium]
MKPLISVIIPCFNHGKYIEEAIHSIEADTLPWPVEIIVVDDGSTDATTLSIYDKLAKQGISIIKQANGGPAKARNTGLENASGSYILPIDADNKIKSDYLRKAIPLLESGEYDIVYAKPIFFGERNKKREFKVRKYDELAVITGNFADACAVYKKEVWIANKGYDTAIPFHGFEDWEFWIHASVNKFRFYYLREPLYYYRINEGSVITGYANENDRKVANHRYIAQKHSHFFLQKTVQLAYIRERYQIDMIRFLVTPFIYLAYILGLAKSPIEKAKNRFHEY